MSKEKRSRDFGISGGLGEEASVREEGLAGTPVTFREDNNPTRNEINHNNSYGSKQTAF